MTRSYEDFYRFANFGDENWKPTHSVSMLGLTGELKAEGRKNFDTSDTYAWEKVSARRVAEAHPETKPFFTPTTTTQCTTLLLAGDEKVFARMG